ncbi:MAG: endolytic transglycosylase MltG [Candidatus Eremiobacteraeota bacterium]|nr:endolytic transglycosylase MltG [Candidatus Eremiobacteraeota bacterium]
MTKVRRALVATLIAIIICAGAIVGAAGLWFRNAVYAQHSNPQTLTRVIIPRGSTFADVTHILADRGVIANRLAFRLLARFRRVDAEVKAGEYRFPPRENEDKVLRELVTGGAQIAVWVTIPEGYTIREIAATLAAHDISSESALRQAFLDDSIAMAGARSKNLEGYLFPSTYLIPTAASAQMAGKILTDEFKKQLPSDALAKSRQLKFSIPQVVTLASLIEREAKADDERPLMAGVYYNRLRIAMPLEVDATIEYIFPQHKTEITKADLLIDSPYNTYKRAGLPPTPIANPGRPSLWAAFHPQASGYLYYVYKGDGHHAFARTLAEHNANVARYLK